MSRPFRLVLTLLSIVGLTLATAPPSGADPVSAGRSAASAPDSDATSNGPTPAEQAENSGKPVATQDEPKNGVWIIRLKDPAVATYTGGLAGLSRTAPAEPGGKLDTNSRAAKAYASHLTRRQNAVKATIDNTVGHSVTAEHRYRYALNGLALKLSADEAAAVAELPGVEAVEADRSWQPDTDVSTQIIAAPAIWGGGTATGLATKGEGVLVGTLDTGINAAHPSFAATDEDGYTHLNPFGEGNYKGVCAEGAANYEDICNSKLVGAYDFAGERTALDKVGHGSHTASTMAGDRHTAHITVGNTTYDRALTGVAPHASLISYKVCTSFGCYSSASVAAVDQAIADGVDVLNYSISGSDRPWNDSVDLAFLAAYNAGIFIAASAGNTGPGESTVAKTGPWNASVAASTNTRVIAMDASVTGPGTAPTELTGMAAVSGSGPGYSEPIEAALIDVGSIADGDQIGCSAFPAGALEGAIALIKRGDCNFSVKVNNAANAGAVGVIVHNQFPGPPIVMGELESTSIPSLMISQADGQAVLAFVSANQGTTLRMGTEAVQVDNPAWKDLVADFSSRGPSQYDLLAPTFTAPGRNILAATAAVGDDPVQYEVMQGTSMSSPHAAGSGALIRALHPDWSPSAIRSALASTANPDGMVKEDGSTPADAFDIGSGLLDLDAASRVGVILDETYDNFVAADPNTGATRRR
ncbi:S8 family serine peptidase [Nakamurella lactea]|uniref:S8 family serine peptidase n=1 Tax=Nakamurella lactea TaxID=459515 RepID=UPI00040BE4A1|nr:S8 family serine peptidase [Nakamurella lactea]